MSLRIALIMMQKNETILLDPWLRYHEAMIPAQSIFVFDNGSSDLETLRILREAESRGILVNRSHNQLQDYFARGTIFSEFINHLDRDDPHDFYFPIDCDEFLACKLNGRLSCSRDDLDRSLSDFIRNDNVLTMPRKYFNSPYHPNRYTEKDWSRKCFFAQGACATLVDGFHSGTSKAGSDQVETNIIYIELHYKPYQEHRRISKQKIEYLVPNPTRRAIANYAKTLRSNAHAAAALLESEYSYLNYFKNEHPTIYDESLLNRLNELNLDTTKFFSDSNVNSLRFQVKILAQHLGLMSLDFADAIFIKLRSIAGKAKRLIRSFAR
jgi:hypothetical protein